MNEAADTAFAIARTNAPAIKKLDQLLTAVHEHNKARLVKARPMGLMAYAVMGGIIVGTLLTLLFLPALYVAWFRIQPDQGEQSPTDEPATPLQETSAPELISAPKRVPVLEAQI